MQIRRPSRLGVSELIGRLFVVKRKQKNLKLEIHAHIKNGTNIWRNFEIGKWKIIPRAVRITLNATGCAYWNIIKKQNDRPPAVVLDFDLLTNKR